ncbi:MAG: SIR2 family protein [Desulfovibrionaceae bacterium]|nr:SIR2 family protein [Desulfovibrionaceae bacterium]
MNAPWHRFYTTNYDNTIEKIDNDIIPVDTTSPLDSIEIKSKRCVHLNGYIGNLTLDTLDKSFKLTEGSYLDNTGFLYSPWYTVFKRDLERCSALVFVGYSLYDIDIERILVNIPNLKDNTYFIIKSDATENEEFSFKQFGNVFKIGVENFSTLISSNNFVKNNNCISSLSINRYDHEFNSESVRDDDIEKLLFFGSLNNKLLESDVLFKANSYVIFRDRINDVVDVIEDSNVIVTSEFCNGKTIFLYECLPILNKRFSNIYIIDDPHSDYINDLISICSICQHEKIIFVIDDYFQYVSIFEYLSSFNKDNIRFLLFSRNERHEKQKKLLSDINFSYKEFIIDILTQNEIKNIINLIDSIGFWNIESDKYNFVYHQCERQISLLLFNIFESDHIKNKIKSIISNLIDENDVIKNITVVELYLCMLDIKIDFSLLSELSSNAIYDSGIRTNPSFNAIFNIKDGMFVSKSGMFCQKVIKNFIEPDYTIKTLLTIADRINALNSYNRDVVHDEILKSCFKFSTIERILPDNDKEKNIISYYERLKRTIKWLIHDPHFWLQYGMGFIAVNDLNKAQQYLNNAYAKAKRRENYTLDSIHTQQARLYILQAIDCKDIKNSLNIFKQGHNLLISIQNSKYKYRQLYLYDLYFKNKKDSLNKDQIDLFLNLCKLMRKNINKNFTDNGSSESYLRNKVVALFNEILK